MMSWAQINLQDAASPVMEELIFFHDFTMTVLTFILIFVGGLMVQTAGNKWVNVGLLEGQAVECIWTLLPGLILIQLAIPSLLLLYMLDESIRSVLTLKVLGHQWYWSYEYSDFWRGSKSLEFDSYMLPLDKSLRLLDTDNRTVLPIQTPVRALVSSEDVLHAWAVPALGVKTDACPGRLNQIKFIMHRPGVWYGQCSEICGANHSFMPIVVEGVPTPNFLTWVEANFED